jgi:uncharacterized C2H2 Zn-finger protein
MEFKTCGICGLQKEVTEFHKMRNNYQYSCKECKIKYQKGIRVMRDTSKYLKCEKCGIVKSTKEFYRDVTKSTGCRGECIMCYSNVDKKVYFTKKYPQDSALLLDLCKDQNDKCNYSDQPFVFSLRSNPCNPVLDLKDPSKGMDKDNIQLLAKSVAELKNGLNEKKFIQLIETISGKIRIRRTSSS